ncbi:hypothetical protein Tco_0538276 [Tanacetum coccineum]
MLAIPHLSQVSSMAEIDSREAQMKLKAGICFRTYLTKEAQAASPKKGRLRAKSFLVTSKHKSSIVLRFSISASLGHNDPETPYTASGFLDLADSDPFCGASVFTDKWSLDELAFGVPTDGPYQTNPHSPDDIISYIQIDREGRVRRIRHEQEIDVHDHQILTREIVSTLKPLEESPELLNESYVLYDHVMNPLTAQQERKTRKDRGTRRGRHSTSSSFAFDQPSSSHLNDDDNDRNDEGTSRASTPSPTRFVNSLTNDGPQVFQNPPNIDPVMEPFFT